MTPRRAKRPALAMAIVLIAAHCIGCWSEDRLSGTPTNLPPGTMPAAPPLTQTPADLAKSAKVGKAKKPRH